MYVIKNAFRCISRSLGRNLLIGIIVLVIATSACVGLSIRQAADSARDEALAGVTVTATISFDRQSAMSGMTPPSDGERPSFDRDEFSQMMGESSALTLEEYQTYAGAESVSDFYYSASMSVNGNDDLEPVSNESTEEEEETEDSSSQSGQDFPGGMGGFPGGGGFNPMKGMDSDFTVVGYSSAQAMTAFMEGSASVTDGSMFNADAETPECLISSELAIYNDLAVGDTITLVNPNNEEETYTVKVAGIYTDSSANEQSFSMFGATSSDPANQIYMSHNALQTILDKSADVYEKAVEDAGDEDEVEVAALSGSLSATYVLSDKESYEQFQEEVRDLGLSDSYTVSSSDVNQAEQSVAPLNSLSDMARMFLIVILIIGAIILVVLNIFNVRERKYEIGVLTAMGMKKGKVAAQFLTEIFAVSLAAVVLGTGIGALFSVPVTNALLADQVETYQQESTDLSDRFGGDFESGGSFGGFGGGMPGGFGGMQSPSGDGGSNPFANLFGGSAETNYVTSVDAAVNLTVVFQMLGIALLLTLVSGMVSMLFVMRYEPLKILANRD